MKKLRLIILMGNSGSGKSTFASSLRADADFYSVSADGMRMALCGGCYPTQGQYDLTRELSFDLLEIGARGLLGLDQCVIVDGTNMRRAERQRWMKLVDDGEWLVIWFQTQYDNEQVWRTRGSQFDSVVIRSAIDSRLEEPDSIEWLSTAIVRSHADAEELRLRILSAYGGANGADPCTLRGTRGVER